MKKLSELNNIGKLILIYGVGLAIGLGTLSIYTYDWFPLPFLFLGELMTVIVPLSCEKGLYRNEI